VSTLDVAPAGTLLRQWRTRRRLSQQELSSRTGVSTRHLSCVETGRARPSRDLLLYLAGELEVPNGDANDLLLAAGFAPAFSDADLSDESMASARGVLRVLVDASPATPTTVIDSRWDLVDANAAALWLCEGVAPHLLEPPVNTARLSLHPGGLAPRILDFDRFAGHLLRHMRHTLAATGDEGLAALVAECEALAPDARLDLDAVDEVALATRLRHGGSELMFLSTVTTFGTARAVRLTELSIEALHPADSHTRAVMDARPWEGTAGA
jgi:transcriptional regulator with XRE-family HTH domain